MTENPENTENKETPPAQGEQLEGIADQVTARDATIENSLVGMVQADGNATVENSFGLGMVAGQIMEIGQSFGGAVVAGSSIEMENSAGGLMVAGGNVDLRNGRAGCVHCQQALVENSTVGVLFANNAKLGEGVKVLMTRNQAIAFGAAFGLVAGMIGFFLRRRW